MARCSHCGKNNRDGSLFCQECGHKLEESVPKRPNITSREPPTCPSCGTVNPAGMNFCKMCGTALTRPTSTPSATGAVSAQHPKIDAMGHAPTAVASKPVTPTPAASAVPEAVPASASQGSQARVACPSCQKQTPAGFAFCQHCGTRLPQNRASGQEAMAPTLAALTPTPPAGVRPPGGDARPASGSAAFAATMASGSSEVARVVRSPVAPAIAQGSAGAAAAAPAVAPVLAVERAAAHGRLIVLRRDGSDGDVHPLESEHFDVGRLEGSLVFRDDPYLAPRHARFSASGDVVRVRSLDAVNGIFLRIKEAADLNPGDHILLGKELLRFEPVAPEERDPPSLVEHGVRIFGSAQREAWGRLRQLTGAGTSRDIWHLVRPEFVLGREEGDVTFPDDEYMSRRHATVRRISGKMRVEDMGSSNGTFIRLRGDHQLRPGDVLRMGDQLLRFEI